jgi:hypothetical protein
MSKKILWHTIQIKVPAEMVELTKSGKVSVKKTLTKTFNISRSQKKQAIKLIPSNDNKVEIVNDGKEWDIDELKKRMTKAKQLEKKNATKNIFEPKEKKMINLNKFEGNIIKRAKELGKAKQAKKIRNDEEYINTLRKYRKLEQIVVDQANGNSEKLYALLIKNSSKINELKQLLDEYSPNPTYIGAHKFLYEPEYEGPSGFSKRKASRRNRPK